MAKRLFLLIAIFMPLGLMMNSCGDDDLSASEVPEIVRKSFVSLFPNAKDIEWQNEQGFYIAEFNSKTFETDAWFNPNGIWAMTVTDYGSLVSQLPIEVVNAFNNSSYSTWIVDDVKYYERTGDSFCMIEVETDGFPEVGLFYDIYGNLLNKVQGYDFNITPNTQVSQINFSL